ncbi:hypothetical protein LCGC14_1533410 [marine sediment metagenome]|uniref:Uncharacterized protein n=1 Tax=marine sediment metagenome TaxID=412755 RepID=A0A0F9IVE1_9ZZZZ
MKKLTFIIREKSVLLIVFFLVGLNIVFAEGFGYDVVGGTPVDCGDNIYGSNHTAPQNGVVDNITAYILLQTESYKAKAAIYLFNKSSR